MEVSNQQIWPRPLPRPRPPEDKVCGTAEQQINVSKVDVMFQCSAGH